MLYLAGLVSVISTTWISAPTVQLWPACDSDQLENAEAALGQVLSAAGWKVERSDIAAIGAYPCVVTRPARIYEILERGRHAFDHLKFGVARSSLERAAERALEAGLYEIYRESQMLLGWLEMQLDDLPASAKRFRAVAVLDPMWRPDAKRYPPQVADAYVAEANALAQTEALELSTTPSGSTVVIGLGTRCVSPCAVHGLPSGRLPILMEHVGYDTMRRLVLLKGGSTEVHFVLSPNGRYGVAAALKSGNVQDLVRHLSHVDEDLIVVFTPGARSGTTTIRVVAPLSGRVSDPVEFDPDQPIQPQEIMEQLELLGSPPPPVATLAGDDLWWLWPTIGLATAVIAAGIVSVAATDGTIVVRP